MKTLMLATMLAGASLLVAVADSSAADDAATFRVFLKDGNVLASYGEVTRLGDRVVFSMRAGSAAGAPLQLVNLSIDRVDWERTERYTLSARATRYFETQAEIDYAELSNQVALTLNEVVRLEDPTRRLALVEEARKKLAEWPKNHYNYRDGEVRQMLGLLDEAIADLRAATGGSRFDLSLIAYASQPVLTEPVMPALTPQQAIEQVLTAARVSDSPVERQALLVAVIDGVERDRPLLDPEWAAATVATTSIVIEAERLIDRQYRTLTDSMMRLATSRARDADVRGVERIIVRIRERDDALGGVRPEAVNALIAAVEEKLDAARRLRLARDRWALRSGIVAEYRAAITGPMTLFGQLQPWLQDIKALAGSTPGSLTGIERLVERLVTLVSGITPPEEFQAAQSLLISAAHLAQNAARIRRDATLANDIARAWDASSAAAGALMLGARATQEIQTLLRPPVLQ